ncbi:MAG: hypothetical protein HOK41_02545 [Nitrospina sp.]|jgi:hypothetical protein|nr:hypothetical protein [Nitrospina sp.]MBT6718378.1 hypothetical protein [Nitrospina sp.]
MLVFKNNIYEPFNLNKPNVVVTPNAEYNERFDPHHFIQVALSEEEEIMSFILRQPRPYWREDLLQFYPYSGKTNSLNYLEQICQILENGLENSSKWQHMNSYHYSFLYDVLARFTFNYNHDNDSERVNCLPELEAQPIHFENFLSNYFFDLNFMTDQDHFNSLPHEQKQFLGYDNLDLFGVINGLIPTREEMALKESEDYPYSIYV